MKWLPDSPRHTIQQIACLLPAGLWALAFLSETVFRFGIGHSGWHDLAFDCLAAGIGGALLVALIDLAGPRRLSEEGSGDDPNRRTRNHRP